MKTIKSDFISKTIRCDADLLLPDNSHKPPVVVMAHGMDAQKDFKLQDFAEKFIAEDPESYDGYMSIVPGNSKWENKMQSRGFLKLTMYRPLGKAVQVKAPTLIMAGRNDSLIPLDAVQKLSEKVPDSELIIVDCNHFGPYQGDLFDLFIEKQTGFLRKHLLET
jgi:fermentation-respiration switch protein FrsA (DUF1100 family)